MKRHVDKIIAAVLLLALLSAVPFSGGAQQKHVKGRALLVGINQYEHPQVKRVLGAEEDVWATREFIKLEYGFAESEIHTLVGSAATRQRILDEFRDWLINETEPGSRVFFLFSGHGSRLPDDNGDEPDGYDETLAPYDVKITGENQIRDDTINELIAQLSGRLAVLVFDSCNSGTISRGAGGGASTDAVGPRYLPSPEEFAQLRAKPGVGTRGGGGVVDYEVREMSQTPDGKLLVPRNLRLVEEKMTGAVSGVVVISAAQAWQLAYPVKLPDGGYRGALSYLFTETQRGRALKFNQLRQEITARIAELQQSGRLKGRQVPAFEVLSKYPLEDQPLFANALVVPAVALANPQSTVKLSLRTRENKTGYHFGETVSYSFTTDTPGYLYLIVFSEGDVATCIFPNAEISNNWLEARSHVITRDGREGFYVREPAGKDVVVALLSATRLNLGGKREEYSWSEVFELLRNRRFSEYVKTRGQTSQKPAELTNWQAVSLVLEAVR